ncbi:MAG: hypothetical protein ABR587_17155 [Candidatus Binatia bacterium]
MKANSRKPFVPLSLIPLALAGTASLALAGTASVALAGTAILGLAGTASVAIADTCSNTCVTMAIPRSSDGVQTRLDGSADAVLWPPSRELRKIVISALNNRGASCDVTIDDVRQDEAPGVAGSGATLEDAVNCDNAGVESSVELRSDRDDDGNGRAYEISFRLKDPDCRRHARADEVVVVVPRDESVTSLKPDVDGALTASYAGSALECAPPQRDARLPRREMRR